MNNEFNEKNLPDQPEELTSAPEEAVEAPVEEAVSVDQLEELTAEEILIPKKVKKSSRHLRYGSMAVLSTVLVVVIALVVGILADVLFERFPLSVDMTEDNLFTVSEQTKEVIAAVDKEVEIVAFFNEDDIRNPSTSLTELNTVYKELHQVFGEYETRSQGKVTVTYADLTADPTLMNEYKAYGDLAQGDILFRCGKGDNEKNRLKSINDFYSYTSQDGYTISTFSSQVELTMASTVNAVISEEDKEIVMLTGHDEDTYTMATLKSLYEMNGYAVSEVKLASDQKIGDKVTTAIIPAPLKDLSNEEVTRLRDWLSNNGKQGRNLMVVVNYLTTREDCPNLYEFLDDEYQIEVTDNLVVETDANRMMQGYLYADLPESPVQEAGEKSASMLIYAPHQFLLKAGTDNTKELFNVPLVSFPESAQVVPLGADEDVEPQDADEYPISGMGMSVKWTYDNSGDESVMVQTAVVVANQGMIDSGLFSLPNFDNERVTLAIMNYINGNEETVDILDKDLTQESLNLSDGAAQTIGILLTFVLPGLVLVICLVVFFKRRHL